MAKTTKLGTKFFAIISALSLVGAGALVAINPALAAQNPTYTIITFDDGNGEDAVGANGPGDPAGSWGGLNSVIADGGDHNSGDVLTMEKYADAWSGVMLIHMTDRTVGAQVAFDYYSPENASGTSWLKLEDTNGQNAAEGGFEAAPGWGHYVIDIADLTGYNSATEFTNIIIFPNYNGGDAGSDFAYGGTYKIDNVESYDGPNLEATSTGLSFDDEDDDAVGAASFNDRAGAFEGLVTSVVDGKLQMEKSGAPWAGAVLRHFTDRKIGPVITFDLYSPESGTTTAWIKLENLWGGEAVEMGFEAAAGLHSYSIDLSTDEQWSDDAVYANLVFFPNYNGDGTSDADRSGQLYTIDNIGFNGYAFAVAPVKTKNPTISGSVKVGKVLTANGFIATWEGEPTLSYKWYTCTAKGTNNPSVKPANCSAISGASAKKLTLKKAQKGKFIRVRVTATNDAGSTAVFSDTTKVKVS